MGGEGLARHTAGERVVAGRVQRRRHLDEAVAHDSQQQPAASSPRDGWAAWVLGWRAGVGGQACDHGRGRWMRAGARLMKPRRRPC